MKIYIKNMVCARCEMAVKKLLEEMDISVCALKLGEAEIENPLTETEKQQLSENLKDLGFELLDDKISQTIERIKNLIVNLVHYQKYQLKINLSTYLAEDLKQDYNALSNLFSENEGITIEHYFITQKIEKVKELMMYDELSLSQIADRLGYSSVAYLSNQFKKQTGLSPSFYKSMKQNHRRNIDEV